MNTNITPNDGGPAFPSPMQDDRDCHARNESGYGGLSIRDWFAGQALAAIVADDIKQGLPSDGLDIQHVPDAAYRYADAMLKARTPQ